MDCSRTVQTNCTHNNMHWIHLRGGVDRGLDDIFVVGSL